MLENWDKVKQYAETGATSAGTAMEKYGIVLESVESKQAQLTAKTQEFYSNVLSDSVLTGLLDIGNGLMDIVNIGDGAVGKILLLTTATLAFSAVLSHLTDNGKKTFAELIAGFIGVSVAEGTATTGAGLLKLALDLLKSHPIILGLSILTTALVAGKAIFDAFNVTLEEQHEKAQQAQADYQEIANELQSVNNELKTTQERIDELNAKDKLSFTEEEELENLKKTNAELEKRQYWLDLEAKQKRQEATAEASKAWDKDFNKSGEYTSRYKYSESSGTRQGQSYTVKNYEQITEGEYIQEQIQYYGELEQKIQDLVAKKDQWTEEEKRQYESLVDEQKKTKDYLESTGAKIQTDFIDAYDVDDATKQKWIDLQDTIQETLNPPTKASKLQDLLDSQTQEWNDYYTQLAKMGELNEDSFTNEFKNKIKEAFNLEDTDAEGLKSVLTEIITHFKDAGASADTAGSSFDDVASKLKDLTDGYELLKDAQDECNKQGSITAETLDSIVEKYPDMAESVALYIAGLKSEEELLYDLQNAYNADEANYKNLMTEKLMASSDFLSTLTDNERTKLENLFNAYGADLSNFKSIEDAKLAYNARVIKELASSWAKYAGYSLEMLKEEQKAMSLSDGADLKFRGKGTQEYHAVSNAISKMQNFANDLDATVGEIAGGKFNSFNAKNYSKGSGSSSSSKEWWETQLDKLKEKLENNEISMNSYINSLEKLKGKLKKGSEGFKEVNKVLQEAKLDNLNNQFERGEITINKYIEGLTKLRKGYKKGTEGYKELTKQINEAKADNLADQYERGEISLDSYVKKLENLRDGYKKNSEEWKKYNDLIKDTKADALNKQLDDINNQFDRGEITTDKYIEQLTNLRKNYKKNSEEYKNLTQTINEAKADNLADQYERGEISSAKYISQLTKIRDSYEKNSNEWKKYNDLIKDTQLNETKKWIEKLQEGRDAIDDSISSLGNINTAKEQTKYAELLSKKYKTVQSDITKIQKKLKQTNLTTEERIRLQEELNNLVKEEVNIRDEIENSVREYYANQKEQLEKEAELKKKQTLYDKEVSLYGKGGKDLWEYNNNKKIEALEKQVEARNAEKEALDEINEREELENNLLQAKLKLQNALNSKTTKILTKQADGTWAYTFSANMADVKSAREEVNSAQKALDDFNWEQDTKKLESQIDKLNENAENLANQYEDAEFWANREYEQTMNSIEQAYGDIDKLVEQWMAKYGTSDSKLTSAYQSLTTANNTLETAITNLTTAINTKYETVGNNGKITPKSFDTGGEIVGSGLILAHDKERVLTQEQNAGWTRLINNIDSANKLVDVAKFNIQGYRKLGTNSINKDSQTVINSVSCNFPSITSPDGLQRAILELPRLALQRKQ